MGLEYAAMLYCLKKRLDSCFDEYIKELLTFDAEQLIESASEILAIKETHYEMRFWIELSMCKIAWPNGSIEEPIREQDAVTLLSLDSPLKELGLKWWFYTLGNKTSYHNFFKALGDDAFVGLQWFHNSGESEVHLCTKTN